MKNIFKSISLVLSVLAVSIIVAYGVMAWTEPGSGITPPNGTVNAPINTGNVAQTKNGNFESGTQIKSPKYCIGADCITSWWDINNINVKACTNNSDCSAGTVCSYGNCCPAGTCGWGDSGIGGTRQCVKNAELRINKWLYGVCRMGSWRAIPGGWGCDQINWHGNKFGCDSNAPDAASVTSVCNSNVCSNGTGGGCKATGTNCSNNSDCCTANCASGVCATATGGCKATGTNCSNNSDCCTANCASGVCAAAGGCNATGTNCSNNAECCSGLTCNSGACGVVPTCKASNASCATGSDCCSATCYLGTCSPVVPVGPCVNTLASGNARMFVTSGTYSSSTFSTETDADTICVNAAKAANMSGAANFKAFAAIGARNPMSLLTKSAYWIGAKVGNTSNCEWKYIGSPSTIFNTAGIANAIKYDQWGNAVNSSQTVYTSFTSAGGTIQLLNNSTFGSGLCAYGGTFYKNGICAGNNQMWGCGCSAGACLCRCSTYKHWYGLASSTTSWAYSGSTGAEDLSVCRSTNYNRSFYCVEQ